MLRLVGMVKIHTNVSNIEAYKPYKLLTIFFYFCDTLTNGHQTWPNDQSECDHVSDSDSLSTG